MTRLHWAWYNTGTEESDGDDSDENEPVESDEPHNDLVYSDDDDEDDDEKEAEEDEDDENHHHRTLHPITIPPPKSSLPLGIPSTTTTTTPTASQKKSSSRYVVVIHDDEDSDDCDNERNDVMMKEIVQQYPPLQSYRNPKTASVATLRNLSRASRRRSSRSSVHPPTTPTTTSSSSSLLMRSPPPPSSKNEHHHMSGMEEDIQRLTQLLQQVQVTTFQHNVISSSQLPSHTGSRNALAMQQSQPPDRQQIRLEMEKIRRVFQTQQEQAQRALQQLIQQHEQKADDIRHAMTKIAQQQQQQVEEEEQQQQHQQVAAQQQQQNEDDNEEFEHRRRRHRESAEPDAIGTDAQFAASLSAPTMPLGHDPPPPENQPGPTNQWSLSSSPSRTGMSASSKSASTTPSLTSSSPSSRPNTTPTTTTTTTSVDSTPATAEPPEEYITRAIKFRAQLIDLERSVAEYDSATDPVIKQKRLQYKKLVNGKINTLAENVGKIQQVAAEVTAAITNAKNEDQHYKTNHGAIPSSSSTHKLLTIGKRYLVNLLSAKVIVRIQAEGFNGYVVVVVVDSYCFGGGYCVILAACFFLTLSLCASFGGLFV